MAGAIKNSDTKIVTNKVRLSYCHLFQTNDKGKYAVTLLVSKTDKETIAKIKKAIEVAKLDPKLRDKSGNALKNPKTTVYDGDGSTASGEDFGEECKGCYVIRCVSTNKPGIVDKNCNEIIDSSEVYSGCYARASVNFFAYNAEAQGGSKGISCGINNVQKLEDGDYLGGRSAAKDDFNDDFFSGDESSDDGLLG